MQWGRGLFRLWVLLSCLWLIVAGAVAVVDWRDHGTPMPAEYCKDVEPNRVEGCEEGQRKAIAETNNRRIVTVAIVTMPPLVVLILGIALCWVISGFRPPEHSG